MNNLPLYKIVIDPNNKSGVFAISLVDEPAIEVDWIKLSKQIQMEFSANQDKQMLFGPILIPNKRIYRKDDNGFEYEIMFDEETISLISQKYNKEKINDNFNFQHSNRKVNAYLIENWITDNPDKSQKYGFELPVGTWFGGVKVDDKKFWDEEVKSDKVKGFSVEIAADVELVNLNNNKNKKQLNFMEIKRKDGVVIYYDGELKVGTPLFIDKELTESAPEGEHELEDGTIVVITNGLISEIKEEVISEEETIEEEEMTSTTSLTSENVLELVSPLFEEMRSVHTEILSKIAELESKLTELNSNEEVSQLKSEVEKLSKMAGADSITKKVDINKSKLEDRLNQKVNYFSKY